MDFDGSGMWDVGRGNSGPKTEFMMNSYIFLDDLGSDVSAVLQPARESATAGLRAAVPMLAREADGAVLYANT